MALAEAVPATGTAPSDQSPAPASTASSAEERPSVRNTSDTVVFASQRDTTPAVQRELPSIDTGSTASSTPASTGQGDSTAAPQTPATSPSTSEPEATDRSKAAASVPSEPSTPTEETVTLSKKELQAREDRRVAQAQRKWERDYQAKLAKDAAELATKQADERLADLKRRSDAGELEADEELLKLTKAQLETKFGKAAVNAEAERAREEERQRLWDAHLKSFSVDPDDDELADVLPNADFKTLNLTLLRRAADPDVLEAAKSNDAIRAWHESELDALRKEHAAALKAAKEAGFTNGQIQAIRNGDAGKADVSAASSAARPTTAAEIELAVAQGSRDPEVIKQYRTLVAGRRSFT